VSADCVKLISGPFQTVAALVIGTMIKTNTGTIQRSVSGSDGNSKRGFADGRIFMVLRDRLESTGPNVCSLGPFVKRGWIILRRQPTSPSKKILQTLRSLDRHRPCADQNCGYLRDTSWKTNFQLAGGTGNHGRASTTINLTTMRSHVYEGNSHNLLKPDSFLKWLRGTDGWNQRT
jgi:hypothetical protein